MSTPIAEDVEKTVKAQSEKLKGDTQVKKFEEASKEFERLVTAGVVSKRGYTLMSVEDAHLNRPTFNSH